VSRPPGRRARVPAVQPQNEIPKDFYAELADQAARRGGLHEFGEFISGIAALPRIVTMHDIDIKPITGQRAGGLVMEATAATYATWRKAGRWSTTAPAGGQEMNGRWFLILAAALALAVAPTTA